MLVNSSDWYWKHGIVHRIHRNLLAVIIFSSTSCGITMFSLVPFPLFSLYWQGIHQNLMVNHPLNKQLATWKYIPVYRHIQTHIFHVFHIVGCIYIYPYEISPYIWTKYWSNDLQTSQLFFHQPWRENHHFLRFGICWYNVGPPSDVNVGLDSPHEY